MQPKAPERQTGQPSWAERLPFWLITLPFALAETIVWAAYYYAFPAFLLIWESDLGWSKTELSGAFTVALIVSALLAPLVGRLIDRGHATLIFAGSAFAAACLLATLAAVTELWQFYLVWLGLGVAMAGSLYEACFAVVTRTLGTSARRGITIIALIAGFAGTVSFPSAHLLSAWLGWRGAALVFAATVAFVAVPLILFAATIGERNRSKTMSDASLHFRHALTVVGDPTFWRLFLLFAAVALNHVVLLTHLLPILADRGVAPETAVLAASMIGPMQVAGRIAMLTLGRNASSRLIFVTCLTATASASLLLLGAGASMIFLFGFVALQGAGYGVTSIIRPVFTAEQFGRKNFGTVAGLLAIAFVGGSAAAPTIAALIWTVGGYRMVIGFACVTSIIGLLTLATRRA
ncbi:MAG: MFS transporter [Pseudomonadota bacterium]